MATLAYRMTEEYKDWKRAIKQDFPTMPDILIDYAIMAHKTNPKLYQNEYKEKKAAALEVKTAKSPVEIVGAGNRNRNHVYHSGGLLWHLVGKLWNARPIMNQDAKTSRNQWYYPQEVPS